VRSENGVEYGDLLKFVDFSYVANVARLNAAMLADLAAAPDVPQNVRVLTQALDNNTELTWAAAAGAPAGTVYEVLWRSTEEPVWTAVQTAGSETHLKLPVSKDNVVFGVRSVDAAGHRSPAVLPAGAGGEGVVARPRLGGEAWSNRRRRCVWQGSGVLALPMQLPSGFRSGSYASFASYNA